MKPEKLWVTPSFQVFVLYVVLLRLRKLSHLQEDRTVDKRWRTVGDS